MGGAARWWGWQRYRADPNFKGRGFVQLTGRDNYTRLCAQLGLSNLLLTNPERANEPRVAARLLARFLGNKEAGVRRALANDDLTTARRLVNGGLPRLG